MTRNWKNVLGLTVAGSLFAVTGSARAADIESDDESGACHLSGSLSVHDDETHWSAIVSDLLGEGNDCYARLVIQRNERSDSELRSFKTNAESDNVAWDGTRKRAQTTGATLYVCVDRGVEGDDCTEVYHVDEI